MLRSPAVVAALVVGPWAWLGACSSGTPEHDAATSAWSLGPTMPRRALEPGVAALGQQVVVAGGFDTSLREGLDITARVDAFDTTDATWTTLPDVPVRWTHSNLAGVGGTLYRPTRSTSTRRSTPRPGEYRDLDTNIEKSIKIIQSYRIIREINIA